MIARSTVCIIPKSSAWMINSLELAGYPRLSATVLGLADGLSCANAHEDIRMDNRRIFFNIYGSFYRAGPG